MVKDFHTIFELSAPDRFTWPSEAEAALRCMLIEEEYREFLEALEIKDKIGVVDALADLLYVVYGTAVTFGIPIDKYFREVHRSNMTKLGKDGRPVRNEHGKVIKGPNYEPPQIKDIF